MANRKAPLRRPTLQNGGPPRMIKCRVAIT